MVRNLDDNPFQEDYVINHLNNYYFEDALLKYSVKDYNGTKKELLSLLDKNERPEAYYLLGLVEYHLNNINKSIEYFTKFINIKPSTFECGFCYLHRGKCFLAIGNYNNAKNDFIHSLNLLPKNDKSVYYGHFYLAIAETNLENYDMAIVDLNTVINNLIRFPQPYIWRAYCNLALDKKSEACKDITKAILLGADDLHEIYFKFCSE